MSPPSLTIVLALEAEPRVYLDCVTDSEERRLLDWLSTRPDYAELLDWLSTFAEEAKAA